MYFRSCNYLGISTVVTWRQGIGISISKKHEINLPESISFKAMKKFSDTNFGGAGFCANENACFHSWSHSLVYVLG